MLKRQIIEYRNNIRILMDVKGEKFAYAVLKNKAKVESAFESLKAELLELKKLEEDDNYKDYLKFVAEREQLAIKYSKKDADGNPLTKVVTRAESDVEQYVIADEAGLEKEVKELTERNKEVVEKREKREQEILDKENAILDTEIEIDIHMVSEVPDTMSAREIEAAEFMIKK